MNLGERIRDERVFFSAFSQIKTVVEDQIAEGNKVASRVSMHCTHTGSYQGIPATGRRVMIQLIDISTLKDGKIFEEWSEFDITKHCRSTSRKDPARKLSMK